MSTVIEFCIRRRFLWRLPTDRWHFHVTKPTTMVGSDDQEFIEETANKMRGKWTVQNLGQREAK